MIKMEQLFVYGTLGPGKPNGHILNALNGSWIKGYLWGQLFEEGWGATLGYPGLRLDDKHQKIHGHIFVSNELERFWKELDAFEGDAYQRVRTAVYIAESNEETEAHVYILK